MISKYGSPLLVCAGGRSSAEGTRFCAVEPLDTALIWFAKASDFHVCVKSTPCCLLGLHIARRNCMLLHKRSAHARASDVFLKRVLEACYSYLIKSQKVEQLKSRSSGAI